MEGESLTAVAVQPDGSILLAGDTDGDWDGVSAGEWDFVMVALSAGGEELWRWQVHPQCRYIIVPRLDICDLCIRFLPEQGYRETGSCVGLSCRNVSPGNRSPRSIVFFVCMAAHFGTALNRVALTKRTC